MTEQHTLLQSAIERRNHYQGRMAENMTNIVYFTKRKAKMVAERDNMKVDTEARAAMNKQIAQADSGIQTGRDNVDADQMLMDSFDDMIKVLKTDETGMSAIAPKEVKKEVKPVAKKAVVKK